MPSGFYVQLDDLTVITRDMRVTVKPFSWNVTGGPKLAQVEIRGGDVWSVLQWLAKRIEIRNANGRRCWWGYVEEVVIQDGATAYGLSIKEMYNRVRVGYVYEVFGAPTSGVTDWGVNQDSVDHFSFVKEKEELSEINASPEMAVAYRDNILATVGRPVATSSAGGGSDDELMATVYCAGDIFSFGWLLYSQPAGVEANQPQSGADQIMGQALTSTRIGFTFGGKISDVDGGFSAFVSGTTVKITGALNSAANIPASISGVDDRQMIDFPMRDEILFEAGDDLIGEKVSIFEQDDYVLVNNVPANIGNRGFFRIRTVGDDAATVKPHTIIGENPPVGTILRRGNSITLDTTLADEFPNLSSPRTVTALVIGTKIAQTVINRSGIPWTLDTVEIPIRRMGDPTDSVRLSLRSDAAGLPGAVIESSSIGGTSIDSATGNIEKFKFSNTSFFQTGQTYWLHLDRTGANDPANAYIVEVDEDMGYPGGGMLLWNGSTWVDRSPKNAHLSFNMLGAWETTVQINQLVKATGQLIGQADFRTVTATASLQYRDGSTYALDELLGLLAVGRTVNGRRIIATCTPDRSLKITEAPIETAKNYVYTRAGEFLFFNNQSALEPGVIPVGEWIYMDSIPPIVADMYRFSPKFLEEAEYDPETGQIRPTWAGDVDVWEAA